MPHEFEVSLDGERSDTSKPEVAILLRNLFQNGVKAQRCRDLEKQKSGHDVEILFPVGRPVIVDFKFRAAVYTDILLELGHKHRDGSETIGWALDAKKNSDWVAYVFKPVWECWLLPYRPLRKLLREEKDGWCVDFGIREAENVSASGAWVTFNVPLPIDIVKKRVGGLVRANLDGARLIVRDGKPEYRCCCAEWGSWGTPRGHFCYEHKIR